MSSEQQQRASRPGGVALAALVLLLALAGVALLASGPDDGDGGRVAVVTSGSGAPVDPTKVVTIDPHGAAAPGRDLAGGGDLARVPASDASGALGPHDAGAVIDGRTAAVSDDPVVRATGLTGRVVTGAGAPVVGAQVTARGARPDAGGMTVMTLKPGPDGEMEMTSPGEVRVPGTTDEDGRFTLTGLDAAFRFTLQVRPVDDDQDLLAARQPAPALKSGQVVDAGDVRLARAARLSGVVRGPDGRPLPDATVRLGGDGPLVVGDGAGEGKATVAVRRAVRVAAPAGAAGPGAEGPPGFDLMGGPSTRTDEAGRFTLARVRPGKHTITATKAGLRAATREVEVAEAQQKDDLELRLADGLAVSVQVVDAQGQPIAGASVQVSSGFGGGRGGAGANVQTDAQGLARAEGLSSSEVTIVVQAEGFASTALDARLGEGDPESPRRVALQSGATVTGRLVRASDGAAVTSGFVFLEPLVHGPDVDVNVDGSNRPDGTGRFTLRGVAPGRYRLRARAPGLAPGELEVTVPAGTPTVALPDVRLGDLAGLDVLVLDPDGAPAADVAVDASPSMSGGGMVMIAVGTSEGGGPPLPMGGARGRTGPDGRARLDGLQPGALAVRGAKPPFADGQATVSVEAGARAEVTVRLCRPARVEGRVVGVEPGGRARVVLNRKGGAPAGSAEAGDDGAFAFERVAPGQYALTLGGPPAAGAWFAVAEGETVTRTVEAAPTATVEGTVTGADGLPAAGATLALGWLDALHRGEVVFVQGRATTDAAGRYRFDGVRPGPNLGVTVTTAAGAKASFRVDVPGAQPVRRDLRLPAPDAGALVSLGVIGDTGEPLVGARVTLERADDGPVMRLEQTTGPDGRVRFEGVPAGRFVASAIAPGCARARASFDVTAGPLEGPALRLTAGGALLVEVLGAGEGEARLTLRREGASDPGDMWFTTVALGGQARFEGLEVGARYEVWASAGGHDEARVTVACDGVDPRAPATLRLRPLP